MYALLRRHGLGNLDRLEPRPPIVRYERAAPGELLHLDTKQLGRIGAGGGHRALGRRGEVNRHRGIGWNRVHVAVDDHSRIAYVEELADESPATTAAFLERAMAFYAGHGIHIQRVLSDNGGCYRSRLFAAAAERLGIDLRKTRPYRPQTNGKAERFSSSRLKPACFVRYSISADSLSATLNRGDRRIAPSWLRTSSRACFRRDLRERSHHLYRCVRLRAGLRLRLVSRMAGRCTRTRRGSSSCTCNTSSHPLVKTAV